MPRPCSTGSQQVASLSFLTSILLTNVAAALIFLKSWDSQLRPQHICLRALPRPAPEPGVLCDQCESASPCWSWCRRAAWFPKAWAAPRGGPSVAGTTHQNQTSTPSSHAGMLPPCRGASSTPKKQRLWSLHLLRVGECYQVECHSQEPNLCPHWIQKNCVYSLPPPTIFAGP